MKCFSCGGEFDVYSKCTACYDKLGSERDQLKSLLEIRDRKIDLQASEIVLLKKLLALKYQPKDLDPRDREPNKYPKYDELMEKKDG
jgi:hypothetical protein